MGRCKLGVVGVGHLGQSHARILASLPDVELVGVVDTNNSQAEAVAARFGARVFDDHRDLADRIDAACVVTPTVFHHTIAKDFLNRGLPVLVEKPLALNFEEASELVDLANQNRTILQVGHIERFNPAYQNLRSRRINPKFVEVERHGAFTGRSTDIGAVMDLMIHDLDLLLDLIGQPVEEVQALGMTVFGRHEDMANARLRFKGGCIAHLTASRMSPKPKRKMRIWAPEGYAGLDFCDKRLTLVQPSPALRANGLNTRALTTAQRNQLPNDVFKQHLQTQELTFESDKDQLTLELEDFVRCVQSGAAPRVNGEAGRDAIAVASRIVESLNHHAWNGNEAGPIGPGDVPTSMGRLFEMPFNGIEMERAAA
jgi:predicted dehydrogenase